MSTDLTPGGGDEEELDETTLSEQELPDEQQPAPEPEGEEEEMPDALLSPTELAERQAERASRAPAPAQAREPDDRSALVSELREIFGGLRAPSPPQETAPPARKEIQPFTLSDEKAAEITEKILSQPGGLAKAIAWAVNTGEQRAMARMAQSTEGQSAMESSGEVFAERYIARKMRDPATRFGKAVEPVFQSILDTYNMAELASMNKADRDAFFEETWERATGRALTQKAAPKAAPSPGVARGAGTRAGPPNRGRVVMKMTDAEKKQLRASSPRLFSGEEGEKRFQRQVWEIEHGVTSNAAVRGMTRESVRFGEAVGFGG